MAVRLGDALWWLGLLLGGVVWIALLALAHSAGPIDEAVFWASLIAALPIGFGYLCRYILLAKIMAAADTVLDPAALPQAQNATIESRSRPQIQPGSELSSDEVRSEKTALRQGSPPPSAGLVPNRLRSRRSPEAKRGIVTKLARFWTA